MLHGVLLKRVVFYMYEYSMRKNSQKMLRATVIPCGGCVIASPEATAAETTVTSSTLVVAGLRLLPAAASEVVLVSKNCKMKNIAAQLPKMTLTRRVFRIMISFKVGRGLHV